MGVQCDRATEAISAQLDGELGTDEADALADHLAGCPDCAALEVRLSSLHRRVRLQPAAPVPDLTVGIMARVAPATPARVFGRASLVVVAVALAITSLPILLEAPTPHAHETRHFAIYDLAVAGGFAYVALRPWVARTLLPLLGALGALMLLGALVDTAVGGGSSLDDPHHLLQFLGIGIVAALARPAGGGWDARHHAARHAHRPPPGDRPAPVVTRA